jgi:hypothetical protein
MNRQSRPAIFRSGDAINLKVTGDLRFQIRKKGPETFRLVVTFHLGELVWKFEKRRMFSKLAFRSQSGIGSDYT